MKTIIDNMMLWSNTTEKELKEKQEKIEKMGKIISLFDEDK